MSWPAPTILNLQGFHTSQDQQGVRSLLLGLLHESSLACALVVALATMHTILPLRPDASLSAVSSSVGRSSGARDCDGVAGGSVGTSDLAAGIAYIHVLTTIASERQFGHCTALPSDSECCIISLKHML